MKTEEMNFLWASSCYTEHPQGSSINMIAKSKCWKFFAGMLATICALSLAGCSDSPSSAPPAPKKWTLMLYLDGDDINMQSDFLDNLQEMIAAQVGSTADVNIVVQLDRYPLHPDMRGVDPRFGGWVITHRFYITPGLEPTEENAIKDWGDMHGGGREVDMSDPDNLADFIAWAAQRFPAQHYMLMLADHGYGWKGLNTDESSFGSHMTISGLKHAIDRAGVHIDLLAFNACLMQMIEVAYELHDSAVDIMVGSEMPGMKWPLAGILKAVTENPGITAREMGKGMNDRYVDSHSANGTVTLSTVDLSRIGSLTETLKELVKAMLTANDFSVVQRMAQAVMAGLDEAIIYSRTNRSDAHGLSIYFHESTQPLAPPEDFSYFYQHQIIRFSTESSWRDFLAVFHDVMGHPQYHVDRRIFEIRSAMTDFEDSNVDLYDFCWRIANYSAN
jgi:hypothetical protein